MVLSIEGDRYPALFSAGGYGNLQRVGGDIIPVFESMLYQIDTGAGLWMYAHNSTNSMYGGWWNDLDMLEVST
jgi:hypothetical protein